VRGWPLAVQTANCSIMCGRFEQSARTELCVCAPAGGTEGCRAGNRHGVTGARSKTQQKMEGKLYNSNAERNSKGKE
jgi:hypothetical protein